MNSHQRIRRVAAALLALSALSLAAASCGPAESAPRVTVTPERVPAKGHVDVRGTGFSPLANVTSHLVRPDGTEFPWLPVMTDSEGAFTHDIDTLLLGPGVHELWVLDDSTGGSSNVARFEVTLEQAPDP